MSHIPFPEGLPGILGPMAFRLETAKPLNELAQVLLRGPSSLTAAERETIASYVSYRNDCHFCCSSHSAVAQRLWKEKPGVVEAVKRDAPSAPVSDKLKALLSIAAKVQQGGKQVSSSDIQTAKAQGATDIEIHDAVLIAAAFCMYNRYVDGLATWTPKEDSIYEAIGERLEKDGYVMERA
jgi:uncharacterized peroxidase-related enzyme